MSADKHRGCGLGFSFILLLIMALSDFVAVSFADNYGCEDRLCDKRNPCPIGCKCVYPAGASVGYCVPSNPSPEDKVKESGSGAKDVKNEQSTSERQGRN